MSSRFFVCLVSKGLFIGFALLLQTFFYLKVILFVLHEENTVFIYSMIYWMHKQYKKENTK